MAKVTRLFSYDLPSVPPNGLPIESVEIAYRIKPTDPTVDVPFTVQDTVAADTVAPQLTIDNPPDGTFEYRFTAIDTHKQRDPNPPIVEKTLTPPEVSVPPGSVTNIQVTDVTSP